MDPKRLFDFLAASPSCYHAVQALSDRLTQEGYTQLHEADAWTLTAGGKYFVTRNGCLPSACRRARPRAF